MTNKQKSELIYLPLGGAGEIGMNLYLYGYGGKWLAVDMGVAFGDHSTPGIEILLPDISFLAERARDLVGIVITHGHEDHLGAVPHFWSKLKVPVYTTPFTASLLRSKLEEFNLEKKLPIRVVPLGGKVDLSPFEVEFITLTHSIPEPNALAIKTPVGTVLHSGDWKFDPKPLIGAKADKDRLKELGDEGILALMCDSTNVLSEGKSRSESEVRESLYELIGRYHNRVAVGCFATNVARVESIAMAAAHNGRHVALVGRSLWRLEEAARDNGLLKKIPRFLTEHEAAKLVPSQVLYICTGCQGEPRAALPRIASGNNPQVKLGKGDVAIFSSKIIPGNEKEIARLHNMLVRSGVEVVAETDHFVHVSGHPGQEELKEMYKLLRPKIAVPIHGETRHLFAHVELAQACGVPETLLVENGSVVCLAPGPAEIVDTVETGKLAVEGDRVIPLNSSIMKDRSKIIYNGQAVVTVVLDKHGKLLADPVVSAQGMIDEDDDHGLARAVRSEVKRSLQEMSGHDRKDDDLVKEMLRIATRRVFRERLDKKPLTEIHLVRI